MNLYLITQTKNSGWDTYDSAVVAAINEYEAKRTHPNSSVYEFKGDTLHFKYQDGTTSPQQSESTWTANPEDVTAVQIGIASEGLKAGTVVSSFNAG